MKRPSFQFYPGDWLRDIALRTVSVEARGLWIDMICYMHEGTPYGHLKINNTIITPEILSQMVGCPLENIKILLKNLEKSGVFSRKKDGTIYSKRMVRDEEIRRKRASGGILGGNPSLLKKDNHKVNLNDNHNGYLYAEDEEEEEEEEEENRKRSSSIKKDRGCKGEEKRKQKLFEAFYKLYPRKVARKNAEDAWKKINCTDLILLRKIFTHLRIQAKYKAWDNNPKYIPHPATWLNQKRWMDEITPKESLKERADRIVRESGFLK